MVLLEETEFFQIPPYMLPVQREEAPESWFLQAGGEKSAKNRDSATELPTTVGQLERWRSTFSKQALNSLTESRRSVCKMIFSFSLDILEIPTMLFFFLHATMSFLRANTSQLSCRKHVEAKKNAYNLCHTFPDAPANHF